MGPSIAVEESKELALARLPPFTPQPGPFVCSKRGWDSQGWGWGLAAQGGIFQSLPPSGVSKDSTEPCLVFDQIWWYLSRSSRPSQLLSYAVETCPAQINLVTFRSLSPCPPPLPSSCKWPRLALSKTRQGSWPTPSSSAAPTPVHPPGSVFTARSLSVDRSLKVSGLSHRGLAVSLAFGAPWTLGHLS